MTKIKQNCYLPLKHFFLIVMLIGPILFTNNEVFATSVFINELHYDNTGGDTGEAIEVAGPAGTDLIGWDLILYNGASLETYGSVKALSGIISDQQAGFLNSLFLVQHDPKWIAGRDGFGRCDRYGRPVFELRRDFHPYKWSCQWDDSADIGVVESPSTPVGFSLQLAGIGNIYEDFSWEVPGPDSFGDINSNQTFVANTPIPEPNMLLLLASGLLVICWKFNRIT